MEMKNVMKKKQKVELTGRFYNAWEHNGWGNSIIGDTKTITGWLVEKPVVGDEIRFKMTSGKISRTMVTEVEYPGDPPDMFFAKLEDIGYLEGDEPLHNPVNEMKTEEKELVIARLQTMPSNLRLFMEKKTYSRGELIKEVENETETGETIVRAIKETEKWRAKMNEEEVWITTCSQCGHEWILESCFGVRCPKCDSPYWDEGDSVQLTP